MCLILFSYRHHRDFPFILAANRDEFHNRPTAPLHFWEDAPSLLAGRDLQEGGTWMGISRSGRFAALTNYRDPASLRPGAASRGRLVTDFLNGEDAARPFLERLQKTARAYNGFNLLVMDQTGLYHYSNRGPGITTVTPGIHGLSNALLDTPWPKVEQGKAALEKTLSGGHPEPESLLNLLGDRSRAPDHQLPDTGVGLDRERMLSPVFIVSEGYGTRTSAVVILDRRGKGIFWERTFPTDGTGPSATRRFTLQTPLGLKSGRPTPGGGLGGERTDEPG